MCIFGCVRSAALVLLVSSIAHSSATAEALTLQQAVEQAAKCNPTVAAGLLSASAARESARGAKALTNPEILLAPSVIGTGGSDSAALLIQPLEINGSRKARGRVAEQEAGAAFYDSEVARRGIVLRVKQLYWNTARAEQVVKLNQENVAYLEALDKAIGKQVDVGKIPGSQSIKSEVELARARQQLAEAELELCNARSALAILLNLPADREISVADSLVYRAIRIDKAKLGADAVVRRPEVLSMSAQAGASRGRIAVARAKQIPDIALEARKETFGGGESGVALAVTLPFLDWGSVRSEKRSAEIENASKCKQLEAVKNSVVLDVEQSIAEMETAGRVVREYESGILDKSTQLAAMAQKGYEKGATGYLDVLEAQRTLRAVRTEYLSALADHAKAVAQLEWAAGVSLVQTEVKK